MGENDEFLVAFLMRDSWWLGVWLQNIIQYTYKLVLADNNQMKRVDVIASIYTIFIFHVFVCVCVWFWLFSHVKNKFWEKVEERAKNVPH